MFNAKNAGAIEQWFRVTCPKDLNVKKALFVLFVFTSLTTVAQKSGEAKIRQLLSVQTEAWNRGDVEGFMQTYWKNDSLMFIGKSGVTKGWQQTLENYKKGYPDTAAMGKLAFNIIKLKQLSPEYFFVVGKWMLKRTAGDLSGHFTLLLQKINGQWVIVADHSS